VIERKRLIEDLRGQVNLLEADLNRRLEHELPEIRARLLEEHAATRGLGRSAATARGWLVETSAQAAVAWVLATVFVRFCEDNGLLPEFSATAHVQAGPQGAVRDWTLRAFEAAGQDGTGKPLFDLDHDPLFQIPISEDASQNLMEFWSRRNEDGGLVHDFTDPEWDTRFLADLYQDLSDPLTKQYGLLQTPDFVVQFILDRTLTPAIRDFGCGAVQMIDPACGSGGFVLESFHRILAQCDRDFPVADRLEQVRRAVDAVHGVDIVPYAVAITRFRLVLAAMKAAGLSSFAEYSGPALHVDVVVGDALLEAMNSDSPLTEGRYHVVVGNPPYVTVKDKALDSTYRKLYETCTGRYSLSVPFAERFYQLAKPSPDASSSGYVGQLMPNSVAKREFGKKLIEDFFARRVEVTEIIDTSGAYIPGHGTPTMIVVGRPTPPRPAKLIRLVAGLRGEPAMPESAELGHVWQAIVAQVDCLGSMSNWVAVEDAPRREFSSFPWVLSGRDGRVLLDLLAVGTPLSAEVERIGYAGVTGADDIFVSDPSTLRRSGVERSAVVGTLTGSEVRDWGADHTQDAFLPHFGSGLAELSRLPGRAKQLWPYRTTLGARQTFAGPIASSRGWYAWSQYFPVPEGQRAVVYAWVATHPHFALLDQDLVPLQSAPVMVFHKRTEPRRILDVLGVLNSSTAAFWLRSTGQTKGGGSDAQFTIEPWATTLEIAGTRLLDFPMPADYHISLSAQLDDLSRQYGSAHPSSVARDARPTERLLEMARAYRTRARARMIALQEEIDWQVYKLYGILAEDLRAPEESVPELALGERAFEIVLARKMAAGELSTDWFARHGSRAITEIPAHWPEAYRQVVQHRINAIESSVAIDLIERPEHKRRWRAESWDALKAQALRSWLLERMESRDLWFEHDQPRLRTLSQLSDALRRDADFVAVARLYAADAELDDIVCDLLEEEHVPQLPALRYKPSGQRKRATWELVWERQRAEDTAVDQASGQRIPDPTPVPPTYSATDFAKPSYWTLRGKFDTPRERFISYAGAFNPLPKLYGWAGWDHWQQACAMASHVSSETTARDEIIPMIAGLFELQPWLDQWHGDFDPGCGTSRANFIRGFVTEKVSELRLTKDEVRSWRPPAPRRGRPPKKSTK